RPLEEVRQIVANARGEVLVFVQPQRIYASTDDGATFAPVEAPQIVVTQLLRDAAGDLWVSGLQGEAKLVDGKLTRGGKPVPLHDVKPKERSPGYVHVVGERFVRVDSTNDSVSVAISRDGSADLRLVTVGNMGHLRVGVANRKGKVLLLVINNKKKSKILH